MEDNEKTDLDKVRDEKMKVLFDLKKKSKVKTPDPLKNVMVYDYSSHSKANPVTNNYMDNDQLI